MNDGEVEVLRRTRLFKSMDNDTLRFLLQGAVPRSFAKGQLIFQHGEEANTFYVVLDGWVKVFRASPAGEEAVFGIFTVGETFAEAAIFMGERYPASAEAVENCRLLCVRGSSFRDRIVERPEVCLSMLGSMSLHLHRIIGQVEQLQTRSSAQRLAHFLVSLCQVDSGSAMVTLPYDKSLIASRLGMKPESLSRALSRLKSFGVIVDNHQVLIPDVEELVDYCSLSPTRSPVRIHMNGKVGEVG